MKGRPPFASAKERWTHRRAVVAWLILLVAAPPWSSGVFFAAGRTSTIGSLSSASDRLKLVFTVAAVLLAYSSRIPRRLPMAVRLLLAYALVAGFGGYAASTDSLQSMLRALRYGLVVVAVSWIVSRLGVRRTLDLVVLFAATEATIALAARLTGLQPPVAGRLAGIAPGMHPNVLAMFAAIGLVTAASMWMAGWISKRRLGVLAIPLGAAIVLTGSRTSLVSSILALAACASVRLRPRGRTSSRSMRSALAIAWVMLIALGVLSMFQLNSSNKPLTALLTRGGKSAFDTTFTGRTVAWSAVLHAHQTTVQALVGQGLDAKYVDVANAFSDNQGVGGTWHAAYLQAGILGAIALASALILVFSLALRKEERLLLPIVIGLTLISVTEPQFNDVAFGLVMLVALACSRGSQGGPRVTEGALLEPRRLAVPTGPRVGLTT